MKLKKYLSVRSNGSVRVTANKPSLYSDEIAIQLNLDIPNQLFEKPTLVADISIDEELAGQSLIAAETIDNAKQLISDALKLELRVETVERTWV